jgi:predicted nicotinamide N-methyase
MIDKALPMFLGVWRSRAGRRLRDRQPELIARHRVIEACVGFGI